MRRDWLLCILVGAVAASLSFVVGKLVSDRKQGEARLLIAINEPPGPPLVERWAPEAKRRAAAELYASYSGESYPTTPRKMFDCGVKHFAFEAGLRHDGRTVAEVVTLSPKQLNCILGLASKYVRIEFLDHKH